MVDKFKNETEDSPEVIMDLVNKFEEVQDALDKDKRDINRYKYNELKSAVAMGVEKKSSKKAGFSARDIFDYLKKVNPSVPNEQAKMYIKKYLEIRSELPKDKNNVYKYRNFEEFVKIVDENYATLLTSKW